MRRSALKASTKPMKRTRMKAGSRPKMTPIRRAAKDEECTLRFPVCNYRTDTTVLCHSNLLADGKGMGMKAPDTRAAFGCSACHDLLDGRAPWPEGFSYDLMIAMFHEAVAQTHRILRRRGLLEKDL